MSQSDRAIRLRRIELQIKRLITTIKNLNIQLEEFFDGQAGAYEIPTFEAQETLKIVQQCQQNKRR